MRAPLTAASPPTSDQPNSPAVCKLTPLNAAGVNPSRAVLKSSAVIAEWISPSVIRIVHLKNFAYIFQVCCE